MIIETTTKGPLKSTTVTGDRVTGHDENGDGIRTEFELRLSADGETFAVRTDSAEIELDQLAVWELLQAVPTNRG